MKTTEVRSGMTLLHTNINLPVRVVNVRRGDIKNARTVRVEFTDGRRKWVMPSVLREVGK